MKKYIITTAGGLGNQMFNYSVWYYLKYIKHENAILYPKRKDLLDHNGYELNHIFANAQKPTPPNNYIDTIIRIQQKSNRYIQFINRHTKYSFIEKLFNQCMPIQLIEFPNWNNYTFLNDILPEIKEAFTFPPDKDKRNTALIQTMSECESVSLHIRRGDYQNIPRWRMVLGDICNKKYYEDAIRLVTDQKKNPQFFVFSDDIDWVKQNIDIPNAFFINWNKKDTSYRDMQLMASCKTNIIANSTFSLMATWLNIHKGCWHIVPQKWRNYYNDQTYKKYIPNSQGWTIINNNHPNVSIILPKETEKLSYILKQSYTDFEVILPQNQDNTFNDSRVKDYVMPVTGNHIFECKDINLYKDRNFLGKQLASYFSNNK